MVTESCDKIDIARILIDRIDGAVVSARVTTLALANTVLQGWASDAPEHGEARCEVRIIFEDGWQCRSRISLKRTHKRISLTRHLRQQLLAMTASNTSRRKKTAPGSSAVSIAPLPYAMGLEALFARYDL